MEFYDSQILRQPDLLKQQSHDGLKANEISQEEIGSQETTRVSLAKRIGRRKENSEGKVSWISQSEWEVEQRKAQEVNVENHSFALCFDDSGKKNKIDITSPLLIDVIKKVIPLSCFASTQDSVSFDQPYAPLFQFWGSIRIELNGRVVGSAELRDFDALGYFLEGQSQYKSIWVSLDSGRKAVSYDMIWALFRAGEPIIIEDQLEEERLFKFTRIEEKIQDIGHQLSLCVALVVHFWWIVWTPVQKRFRQKSNSIKIERFAGHRSVSSLPVYPLRYMDENSRSSLVSKLENRGRRWVELISSPPSCYRYSGPAIPEETNIGNSKRSSIRLKGRIILDQKDAMSLDTAVEVEVGTSFGEIDEKLNDSWNSASLEKLSSPDHFLLCPPQISCFHVGSGKRYIVSITNLAPANWSNTAIDQLILDESKKSLLRALVGNHNDHRLKSGDIIENKGRGLTIVLHGPPGVGKTLTAECIAEYAKKPIIPLSVGNLVAVEDSIEERLIEAFENASRLGAILLLDEADVVLEARSFEDVRRNGIVSVFLRQLEYYSGILFLTTNRINSMDPAFESRIQVSIPYTELTRTQREGVWKSLLNSNLIDVTEHDKAIIIENIRVLSEYQLNGRQIRNTLKLAFFLALDDIISDRKVQLKHIEKALKEALQFQEFFEEGKRNSKNKNSIWKPFAPSQTGDYL